jgi:cell division protein ZapA
MDQQSRVVHVEIHGQRYRIRSGLDAGYVTELAAYVDEKMQLAAKETTGGDTLKIAVLAALNIADEFFRASNDAKDGHDAFARRTEELERMLDLVLADGVGTEFSRAG